MLALAYLSIYLSSDPPFIHFVFCAPFETVGGCCDLVSLVLYVVPLLVYSVTVNCQRRSVLASSGHLENIMYCFISLMFC